MQVSFFRAARFVKYKLGSIVPSKMKSVQSVDLFRELGVSGKICKCLSAEGITIPTVIQHEVLPTTLTQSEHCIIQSPTGSGKTLAFLIPALQDFTLGFHSLILVPSRELAIQIEHLAMKLILTGKLKRSVLTLYSGGRDSVVLKDIQTSPPNIIIGTPKRILELVNMESTIFKSTRRIILDEVDKLLPSQNKSRHIKLPSKEKKIHHEHLKPASIILKRIMHRRGDIQCVASSATINEDLINELVHSGWSRDYRFISASRIESLTTPKTIKHGYILDSSDTNSTEYNKLDVLATFMRKNPGKAMIVIHRHAPISKFMFDLKQRNLKVVPLHEHTLNAQTYSSFLQQFQSGDIEAIVATEETIRGTDFMWMDRVFLMNVPCSALEYLHISGRVGRLGKPGQALVVVDSKKEIERMGRIYRRVHVVGEEIDVGSA